MTKRRMGFFVFFAVLGFGVLGTPAHAGLQLDEGMWRLELNNDFGVYQGSRDRTGDYDITGFVDYEMPASSRITLGLRLMPLFVYTQDGENEDRRILRNLFHDRREYDDTVWGAGLGPVVRMYQVKDEYRGWYGEIGVVAFVHGNKIAGNSSNLNFLTTFGVGYQFKSDWHIQAHYQHISNASLGSRNSGANTLGIGIGYRF